MGPGSVVVHFNWDSEGSLGGSLALLTQPAQLQDLMSRLNKNGYRCAHHSFLNWHVLIWLGL